MNSWKWTFLTLGFEIGVAWAVSFVIYQGGRLLGIA
jgi:ferrous iron transport protein B